MAPILAAMALAGCTTIYQDNDTRPPSGGGGIEVGTSALEVDSSPGGAKIIIDGSDTGLTTPAVVNSLDAGVNGTTHEVRLDLPGYHPYGTVVTLYSETIGNTPLLHANLVPLSADGVTLNIQTAPPGAQVVIDSRSTGETTPMTVADLGPSRHTVQVELTGYEPRTEVIDLAGKEEETMVLQLTRKGRSAMSGTVFDLVGGGLVVDATVRLEGTSLGRSTTAQGTYVYENLSEGYYDVVATKTLDDGTQLVGRRENVYVDPDNGRMMTADIGMATAGEMGTISGTVRDTFGRGISNAYVYVDMITVVYFAPVSEDDGSYSFVDIPETGEDESYYVVASAPGFANGATEITLSGGQHRSVDLTLEEFGEARPSAPLINWAQALTYPASNATILDSSLGVRALVASRQKDPEIRRGILERLRRRHEVGIRAFPPSGYMIENDVAWETNAELDLAGYRVRRSEQQSRAYSTVSIIWDPNASFLADISPDLGPRTTFYYDILAFNLSGEESSPSEWRTARPLQALEITRPVPGSTASSPPTFAWEPVAEAQVYEILVFDRRPDYDTFSQTGLVWDNRSIPSTQTSITYGAGGEVFASLQSGEEYWVAMIAGDGVSIDDSDALSFSSVVRFIAP
jgi:hypothetical protein